MSEADWELFTVQFNALSERLRGMERRTEDLEARCTRLERQLRERDPEAEVYAERPVLKIVEPEQVLCPRCEKCHSPELPCVGMSAEAEDRRALNL